MRCFHTAYNLNLNQLFSSRLHVIPGVFVQGLLFLVSVTLFATVMAQKSDVQTVVHSNGIFTKNLYQILSQSEGNVFFSPISVHTVLSMAYQGTKGETQAAFTKTLKLPDIQVAAEGYKKIIELLNNVSDVKLHIANKIFIKDGYNLQNNFKDVMVTGFLSEVQSVNFAQSKEAANLINGWVGEKTENKINDIITSNDLNELTRLVLVNAIYFKGNWAEKFNKENTNIEKFYINANETVDVEMMSLYGKKFFYKEDDELDAKIIDLPYTNSNLSLVIILPNKIDGIGELEQKLDGKDFTKLTIGMHKVEVNLKLPKFKIETTIDMKDPLSQMGLDIMFNAQKADFSGMIDSKEQLYVSKVVQKAFIEVNEEGAEAAAATGVHIMMRKARIQQPEDLIVDHPFICVLSRSVPKRRRKNIIFSIFVGRISNISYR